jgi:diadenosine tetraphosphate (Ap4A) HIT family hydrolase
MPLPLPKGDPCYFCEIIRGNADRWNVIEQTDLTMTVLNGRQYEIGQCIVVPIRHAPTLLELDDAEAAAVMSSAKRLAEAMMKSFAPDGLLLYQNNGLGSGQEVPHFHLHVVPRREGSDWGFGPPHLAKLKEAIGPPEHNYATSTRSKTETIETLRKHYGQPSSR